MDVVARLRAAGCVFAEDEARVLAEAARDDAELAAMVEQRVAGEPLEQIVGWAEFCGLRIAVAPGVFVPRRRTEFLVELAAALTRPGDTVVDLCCGSGALGAALASRVGPVELHAADVDPVAVACAHRNIGGASNITGTVHQGDLFDALPATLRGGVHTLLVNVPYVPSSEVALLPSEARVHEPRRALDGGADGLDVLRRVAAPAPDWLAPGGHLLSETSERQAAAAERAFAAAGLAARTHTDAERGATIIVGQRPFAAPCA